MRFLRTFAFVGLASLLCIATPSIFGQSGSNISGSGGINQIKGRIYLPNGRSPDNPMRVELQSLNFGTLTVDTDGSGSYAFQNLAAGNYTVVVDAGEAFEVTRESVLLDTDVQGPIRMAQVRKVVTVPIHLQLTKRAKAVLKNEVVNANWTGVPKGALDRYRHGLDLLKQNKHDEAEREFESSIREYPGFAPAHVQLGKLYLAAGKLDEATNELRLGVQYDPKNFDARVNYGICLLNKKEFKDASEELAKAAEIDQSAVTPRFYLGLVYLQEKDFGKALTEMEAASTLNGDSRFPLLHRYLGGIYLASSKKIRP